MKVRLPEYIDCISQANEGCHPFAYLLAKLVTGISMISIVILPLKPALSVKQTLPSLPVNAVTLAASPPTSHR